MKPALFVLAAGMGSRYGGLKQLDCLGPNGETIMDYSVYDALRSGFERILFVIRRDMEKDFRDLVLSRPWQSRRALWLRADSLWLYSEDRRFFAGFRAFRKGS